MQTQRRWYTKAHAPTEEELASRVAAQDATARDTGYVRVSSNPPAHHGDVFTVDLVYEEAREGSEVAKRADAMGTRAASPQLFGLIAICILVAAFLLAQQSG